MNKTAEIKRSTHIKKRKKIKENQADLFFETELMCFGALL